MPKSNSIEVALLYVQRCDSNDILRFSAGSEGRLARGWGARVTYKRRIFVLTVWSAEKHDNERETKWKYIES